ADAARRYVANLTFASKFWLWSPLDLANEAPFWSLSYEAVYYVAIGFLVFTAGTTRIMAIAIIGLLAGPSIVVLAPIWFMGYAAYHMSQRRQVHVASAAVLWLGSTVLVLLSCWIDLKLPYHLSWLQVPHPTLGFLLAAYVAALSFAVGVFAFNSLSNVAESV